jgi:RNA polymerase sigma factor (sigma-70 family)
VKTDSNHAPALPTTCLEGVARFTQSEPDLNRRILPLPVGEAVSIGDLTARVEAGDEAAFNFFYNRYCDRLFRYLIVLTRGNEEFARELLQTTMTKIVRSMRAFSDEPHLWNWLAALARNCFIDALRKMHRAPQTGPLKPEDSPVASADGADNTAIMFEALDDCLAKLDGDERNLIEAFYFQGNSHSSVAQTQNTTPKAVESKLARVRQKLRSAILKRLRYENS